MHRTNRMVGLQQFLMMRTIQAVPNHVFPETHTLLSQEEGRLAIFSFFVKLVVHRVGKQ